MSIKKRIRNTYYILINSKLFVSLVLVILGLLWWGAALLFNPETSFTVLKYEYSLDKYKGDQILKGDSVKGEFKSTDNHLGIIYVNFDKYIKPDYKFEDEILFKFKEKGSRDWQYTQKYRSGYFENFKLFPFGVPLINNSQGKTYNFEISSLKGNNSNSIRISSSNPKFISAYFFPVSVIKQNPIKYLVNKSINSITRIDFIFSSIIFALPLIYFLLFIGLSKKTSPLKGKFVLFIFVTIFIDIIFIKNQYTGVFLALIGCYLAVIKANRLESSISILFGMMLIFAWIFFSFFGINFYSDKLNIWSYFFLVTGALQILAENKFNAKKMNGHVYLFDMIKKNYGKIQLRK